MAAAQQPVIVDDAGVLLEYLQCARPRHVVSDPREGLVRVLGHRIERWDLGNAHVRVQGALGDPIPPAAPPLPMHLLHATERGTQ